MNKKLTSSLLLLLAALLLSSSNVQAADAMKREMRAAWIATVYGIDWPTTTGTSATVRQRQQSAMITILDDYKRINMNAVYFQARPMADALYQSSYEPWSSYVSGTRGTNPGWDPLAFVVEECHKRGIECHVWINPYRFSNSSGTNCNTALDQAVKNSGILMQVGESMVFNPGLQASTDRIVNVCREIIQNYNIDGIIFDDYFYPSGGTTTGSSAPDYQLWQNSGTSMTISNWRRDNVNRMVQAVYDMVQETRPGVKFGIGPAGVAGTASTSASKYGVNPCPTGSDWQYETIYSDPVAWLYDGSIDYISPQLYWKTNHSTNPFGPLTNWWSYCANHFGRHHYASHSISFLASSSNTESDWAEVAQQISYSRQYNLDDAPGVVLYSGKNINGGSGNGVSGLGDYLLAHMFTNKVLTPRLTWKTNENFGAPTNAHLSSNTLSWTGINTTSVVKYAVYAIPTSVPPTSIFATNGDGIKADYYVDLTWDTSFTLDSKYVDGYWFAITTVDGWGNESSPAYVGAAIGEATKVDLISPVNGETTTWSQLFRWSAADDATYRLQVASDNAFTDVLIDMAQISTNSATVDLTPLASTTTYYWRIITSQDGYFDMASDPATFSTNVRTPAPAATLIAPAAGARLNDTFSFAFTKSAATVYTLQIANDQSFANVIYSTDEFESAGSQLSHSFNPSLVGLGTFYWRVVCGGPEYTESHTATRPFTITDLPIGNYEAGYVVKKDIDTYEPDGKLRLENKWIRSVKTEYDNIYFAGNGMMNRGFTVKNGKVMVIGRSEGSSTADVTITHYSAETGERIKVVPVSSEVKCSYYPGNDIFQDNAGNVLISNLLLNIGDTPLKIYQVDPETGDVVLRASLTTSATSTVRLDHCNVYGDVTSDTFYVFAAMSNGTQIVRWTITNGEVSDTRVVTARSFYPSTATSFGIAPRIYPVSETIVYITGGNTQLTRYAFTTGRISDSFNGTSGIAAEETSANGAAFFTLGGKSYMFYPYNSYTYDDGHRYMIAEADGSTTTFSRYSAKWIIPKQGIGNINSTTYDAPCVVTDGNSANQKMLYMMVPGNGLAAYSLTIEEDAIKGDLNQDGIVDVSDLNLLLDAVLNDVYRADGDLNQDGLIDVTDINSIINIILN